MGIEQQLKVLEQVEILWINDRGALPCTVTEAMFCQWTGMVFDFCSAPGISPAARQLHLNGNVKFNFLYTLINSLVTVQGIGISRPRPGVTVPRIKQARHQT